MPLPRFVVGMLLADAMMLVTGVGYGQNYPTRPVSLWLVRACQDAVGGDSPVLQAGPRCLMMRLAKTVISFAACLSPFASATPIPR